MRKLILIFLLLCSPAYAGLIDMPQYAPTGEVTDVNLNGRFNSLANTLNGDLTNENAAVSGGFRFIEILAALPANGNQGRVVYYTSNNTLNFDTGIVWIATALLANSQTFTGTNTFDGATVFDGTVTLNAAVDLNAKLTADANEIEGSNFDINGGTMDSVNIGGETATGMLFVNDASDDADGLGDQGTTGEYLQSAGAGANPVFAQANGLSNVIFAWSGNDTNDTIVRMDDTGHTPAPGSNDNTFYALRSNTAKVFQRFKFYKKEGYDTVTIHARIWSENAGATAEAILEVDIGGASNSVTSVTSVAPSWVTATTIDVSGLSDDTLYDGVINMRGENASFGAYCSAITLIVS